MIQWLKDLLNIGETTLKKEQIRKQLESRYNEEYNIKLQKYEDDSWCRDINYCAEKMLLEYKKEMALWRLSHSNYTVPYTPLIIVPLPRKLYYTVHHRGTARFANDTKRIHNLILEKYNQLIDEAAKTN